jgi:hypothetical protein
MAGGKSNFLELELLDHVLGNAAYSAPATTYVALFTATPSDTGGGTEVSGNAYARVAVTNNATNWPAASAGSKSNGTAVTFPTATPSGWGVVTSFGIFDAASAGNLLYWGPLTANRTVAAADTPSFAIGSLIVTED